MRYDEVELHGMLTSGQIHAAHHEIATHQFSRFPIHGHAPIGIVLVIQQQYRQRRVGGGEDDVFRRVTNKLNRTVIFIGRDKRQVFGRSINQNGFRRIKI